MLRRRLTFPAAGIALVLSFVLTGLGIWAGNVIVSIMSNQLIDQMTRAVRREVVDMITFGDRISTRMVNDIARHDISLSNPVAIRRALYGVVSDEPNVRWLACGNEAGGMTDAGRLEDGTIVFLMTDQFRAGVYRQYEASPDGQLGNLRKSGVYFDTRENRWYTMVRDTRARYWTEPFLGSVERLLGIALSAPVFNRDGSFAGVCNVKLIFTALSDWMKSVRLGESGRAFIIDSTGHLIATSGGVSPITIGADGKHLRLLASEAADPIVRETARHVGRYPEIAGPSSTEPRVLSFDDRERGRIYAAVDRFEAPGELKWTIISAVPASDFLGPVYHAARLSIAIGTIIVAVFVVLGLWVVGRTLRPLTALTQAAQTIAKGEWRDVPEVRRNDEVGLLAHAFTVMTARLKETLDGLSRSETKLEEAQRVSHVGYWERDLDTNRITWSDETYRIHGLTPGEGTITVAGVVEQIHPEDRPIWSEAAAEALRGASRWDLEYRVARPNGETRIVYSQGDLTRDAAGRPRSMFGTIQDITDRKRAEEALQQAQADLAHVTRVTTLGELAASIAHEVNQPLAAIVADATASLNWLAAADPPLGVVREALGAIVKDGHRAAEVIQRIRELATKSEPRKTSVDLNGVIHDVVSLLRIELRRQDVALTLELASALPPVLGDRIQLQQVVLNLAMNAIDAMAAIADRPRELVMRSAQSDRDRVTIAVQDTGVGIAADHLGQVFSPFFTTKPGGMGMGLSISRSIIEAHGGRLWATPNAPHGATFQFSLPVELGGERPVLRQTPSAG
jgi:PAS domain S-box-containing protein